MNEFAKPTLKQVIEAHQLVTATIATIYEHEDDFKHTVLKHNGWYANDYTIVRCHAALRYRLTLEHDDGREKDVYIDASEVYDWVHSLGILGE